VKYTLGKKTVSG